MAESQYIPNQSWWNLHLSYLKVTLDTWFWAGNDLQLPTFVLYFYLCVSLTVSVPTLFIMSILLPLSCDFASLAHALSPLLVTYIAVPYLFLSSSVLPLSFPSFLFW